MPQERLTLILDGASDRLVKAIDKANERFSLFEKAAKRAADTTRREYEQLDARVGKNLQRLEKALDAVSAASRKKMAATKAAAVAGGKDAKLTKQATDAAKALAKAQAALTQEAQKQAPVVAKLREQYEEIGGKAGQRPVSYTHLTLPTILRV